MSGRFFTTELPGKATEWPPTPVLFRGKFHGWRSLVGYCPWDCKELDTSEQLHWFTGTDDKLLAGQLWRHVKNIIVDTVGEGKGGMN